MKDSQLANKIKLSLPIEYQGSGGMMLKQEEFVNALTLELWRLVPVHPLGERVNHPPLPGSRFPILGTADPAKLPTLPEQVAEAMANINRKVEGGPDTPATAASEVRSETSV